MRARLPDAVGLAALLAALLAAAVARAAECPVVGALYRARPTVVAHPDPHEPPVAYRYQLRIGLPPPGADYSAIAELYRFQAVSLRTGKVVSELRMLRICGMGRAPCIVAPYAILLPGLKQTDRGPDFTRDWLRADLRFFTPERVVPDLDLQELWVRESFGPPR